MAQQSSGLGVANVTPYSPDSRINNLPGYGDIKEPQDNNPSDSQPPGVDEEVDYNSLEEALTG
mgnify:CR=1 FL=1